MEYQILSILPTTTASATGLTTYTFVDNRSKGIQYNTGDVEIVFFIDTESTDLRTARFRNTSMFFCQGNIDIFRQRCYNHFQ